MIGTAVYFGETIEAAIYSFYDDNVVSISIDAAVDVIQDELTADVVELSVVCEDETIKNTDWATPIWIYRGDHLEGKFYFTGIKRTGPKVYEVKGTSAVGLMEYETFYGGIYEGKQLHKVVEEIIGTNGLTKYAAFSYSIHRGKYGDQTDVANFRPFQYRDVTTESKPFRRKASFTLNEMYLNDPVLGALYSNYTVQDIALWGIPETYNPGGNIAITYGIYIHMTRPSVNDPWPDFGEVFFMHYTNSFSLGTPTGPTTYTVDLNQITKTVNINGTSYSLASWPSYYLNVPNAIFAGGNMARGDPSGYTDRLCFDADYYYQEEYTYDSTTGEYTLFSKPFVLVDRSGNIYAGDSVNFEVMPNTANKWAEINQENTVALQTFEPIWDSLIEQINYAEGVANLLVYGWLPITTKREALHQLLFSQGLSLLKDQNGELLITVISESSSGELQSRNTYENGSEEYLEHVNGIEVVEHGFSHVSGTQEVIYENMEGSTSTFYVAVFTKGPIYNNPVSNGLSVFAANCNAAIVSGIGSLSAELYNHDESKILRTVGSYKDGKTINVSETALVTSQNSEAVLDRLSAYYSGAYMVKNEIVITGEKCGVAYDIVNPFGQIVRGILSRLSSTISAVIKGSCEFVCGFEPVVNYGYTNYVILTGDGTWEVPESVFEKEHPRIRMVLIGGGRGGDSGYAGANGQNTSLGSGSSPAEGGSHGECGTPGKVIDITINNPAASYTYSAGIGGAGGEVCTSHDENNPGSNGTATTVTDGTNSYTSDSGTIPEHGYANVFNGEVYAGVYKREGFGEPSTRVENYIGGDGASGGYVKVEGNSITVMQGGIAYLPYALCLPGLYGANYPTSGNITASGGAGGGGGCRVQSILTPSLYAGNGGDAYSSGGRAHAGNGGDGGDAYYDFGKATDNDSRRYGYGGHGGCGGGGGGSSGWANSQTGATGTGGRGGRGDKGYDGGDGCVLIYY